MKNYKLLIQYEGTRYSGWQIQSNAVSVQQKITDAINIILKSEVNLIGSGRTDTGVHAIGQAANFRYEKQIDLYRFKHSLNSILPEDIAVTDISEIEEKFHARYDAKRRSYIYLLTTRKTPLLNNFSFYYHGKIDLVNMNKLSAHLKGSFDFRSFCKKSAEMENTNCTIYAAQWREIRGVVMFYIEADRFLHGMVRTITGTILHLNKINGTGAMLSDIISGSSRELAGEAVPAKGLFLYKVKY